jgi:hypothetical protein
MLKESLSAYNPGAPPDPPEKVAETVVFAQTAARFGEGIILLETRSEYTLNVAIPLYAAVPHPSITFLL